MLKKRRLVWAVILMLTHVATYLAAPYIKEAPNVLDVINPQGKPATTDVSQRHSQAYLAVVIEDKFISGDKTKDCQWAEDFITANIERRFRYLETKKHFGYTAFVFKLASPNEKTVLQ